MSSYGNPPPQQYAPPPQNQYQAPPQQYQQQQQPYYPQQQQQPPYPQQQPPYQQAAAQPPWNQPHPPPGQYGSPPPPGQYGSPPPPQGAPSPYSSPPPQQGYGGYPQNPGPMPPQGYGPPQAQYAPPPPQATGPPPPQPRTEGELALRNTATNVAILNSQFIDQWGRAAFTITTQGNKQTTIRNAQGHVFATIDFDHNAPRCEIHDFKGKVRDLISKTFSTTRNMKMKGVKYDWKVRGETIYGHTHKDHNTVLSSWVEEEGDHITIRIPKEGLALGNEWVERCIFTCCVYESRAGLGDTMEMYGNYGGGVN